jgi:hypothetical protein
VRVGGLDLTTRLDLIRLGGAVAGSGGQRWELEAVEVGSLASGQAAGRLVGASCSHLKWS